MKITNKPHPLPILSSRTPDSSPDSIPTHKPKNRNQSRLKPRNPGRSGAGLRVRRDGFAPFGRRSRPETPLLRWKYDEVEKVAPLTEVSPDCSRKVKGSKGKETTVSVRKLAGVLWRLHLPEKTSSTAGREAATLRNRQLGFQDNAGHSLIPFASNNNGSLIHNPWANPSPKNGHLCKFAKSFKLSNCALEGSTKWNPVCSNISADDAKSIDQNLSILLNVELEQAQTRIQDLESEKRASKKKLEHFLRKLSEEKSAWRTKEHEKIRAVIDEFKTDLNKERKARQRLEHINSKLAKELADTKLLAKRYMHDYDKEKKGRVLIEEVCDELAKEIGEDKSEVEALKNESLKLREEVEDERKMLQMAEVWREERVQMKLIDAKVALEERYSYMNKLVFALEGFLSSTKTTTLSEDETTKAESLCQAAGSINIQEFTKFSYDPPKSDDIFAVFDDVHAGEANDDDSGWETVSHRDSNYSGSVTEENAYERTPITETNKVVKHLSNTNTKKGSSSTISRLWRSSNQNNVEKSKTNSVELSRFSNETAISTDHVELGQWSSPEAGNPYITRGIKGCIEWPLVGMQKSSLKSKLLEARMESQKIQLRQALKQKI